jgi:DNA polymerase III subunit beta
MKFSCEASQLARVLKALQNAINLRKSTLTVLNYALVEAKDDSLTWTACDLETYTTATVPAKVSEGGRYCLHLAQLASLVALMGNEHITVCVSDGKGFVISKRGQHGVNVIHENDFPVVPECDGRTITLPLPMLREAVSKCAFAARGEDAKTVTCSILIEKTQSEIAFVATDTHRMSLFRVPWEGDAFTTLIKAGTAVRILRAATGDQMALSCTDNLVSMDFQNYSVTTGLMDGAFPNYKVVVPKWEDLELSYVIDAAQLQGALDRVALREDNTGVLFTVASGTMKLETQNTFGSSLEEVQLEGATGDAQFKIETAYVQQYLCSVAGEKIELRRNKNWSGSSVFRVHDDDSYTHLIMPKAL